MADSKPLRISEITRRIKGLLTRDPNLQDIWIQGEVSSFTVARSGHIYYSLKDREAQITCVMWSSSARRQRWLPEEGDEVRAYGKVDVYAPRGNYQFISSQLEPEGRGSLYAEFERLRARMQAEGLFDRPKKPIPAYPQRIGVVTSSEADAWRDVQKTLRERWPNVEVVLFPSLVQGREAPARLVQALKDTVQYNDRVRPLDTVLLVRGGGSVEDLWAFNDEQLVYTLAEHPLPVITGVGHETDSTLVDFVSDLRAATPTAAAAAATPDRREVTQRLRQLDGRLRQKLGNTLSFEQSRLGQMIIRLENVHPMQVLRQKAQELDQLDMRLQQTWLLGQNQRRASLANAKTQLEALSPFAVLERGYSVVRTLEGQVITAPDQAPPGELLKVDSQGGAYPVVRQQD